MQTNIPEKGIFEIPPNIIRNEDEINDILVKYKQQFRDHLIQIGNFHEIKLKEVIFPKQYSQYGFDENIQLGSQFDYLNLTTSKEYEKLDNSWGEILPFEVFNFTFNETLERKPEYLKLSGNYGKANSMHSLRIEFLVRKLAKELKIPCEKNEKIEACLSLVLDASGDNAEIREIEYELVNKLVSIKSLEKEQLICIVAPGYNVASMNRYKETFESIERLNYTNFKVVVVDDNSPDRSAQVFYDYLNKSNLRLRNRITIVRNLVKLGMTGNLYLRIKQFCRGTDIVVNLDLDDKLLGFQTLKIVNAFYQNPEIWLTFSDLIQKFVDSPENKWFKLISYTGRGNYENYRTMNEVWFSYPLRTSRFAINDKIPLHQMIEYSLNKFTGYLEPTFYQSSSDRFYEYSLMEMSGYERAKKMNGFYYLYLFTKSPNSKCYREFEVMTEYKSRVKIPFERLENINNALQIPNNYEIPELIKNELLRSYKNYQNCLVKSNPNAECFFKNTKFVYSAKFSQPDDILLASSLQNEIYIKLNCTEILLLQSQSKNEECFSKISKVIDFVKASTKLVIKITQKVFLNKCLFTKDYELNSLMLYYPEYSSFLIETKIFDILEYDIKTFIGKAGLSEKLWVSKFEFEEKVYCKISRFEGI